MIFTYFSLFVFGDVQFQKGVSSKPIVTGIQKKICPENEHFLEQRKYLFSPLALDAPSLDLLNAKISENSGKDSERAYKLERASLLLKTGKKEDAIRALADLNDVSECLEEEALHLKSRAFSILDDWKSFQVIEVKLASLKNKTVSQTYPSNCKILQNFFDKNPNYKKEWDSFPAEWQTVILDNFFEIKDSNISNHEKAEYVKNAIDRFNILYNELALTTEFNVEKTWLSLFKQVGFSKANELITAILDFSVSLTKENRPQILQKCLARVLDDVPDGIDQSIALFKQLKEGYLVSQELTVVLLDVYLEQRDLLEEISAEARNNNVYYNLGNTLTFIPKKITRSDVVLQLAINAFLFVKKVPELVENFRYYFKINFKIDDFFKLCKLKSVLGFDVTMHFLKNYDLCSLPFDCEKPEVYKNLKKVLQAEIKWKHKILPIFDCHVLSFTKLLDFFSDDDPAFQYMNSDKIGKSNFIEFLSSNFEKLKSPEWKDKLINILKLEHLNFNILSNILDDYAVFEKSYPATKISKICNKLIELNNNPNVKSGHIVSSLIKLWNGNDENGVLFLVELPDEKFRSRLLGLYASGDIALMMKLLEFYLRPTHPFTKLLLAQTSTLTAPIAKALLKENDVQIIDWFKKKPEDESFTSLDCAILALSAQKEFKLLRIVLNLANMPKISTALGKTFLLWIEKGYFNLAHDLFKNGNQDDFWQQVIDLKIPPAKVNQLRNLRLSLKKLPFSKENAKIAENIAKKLLLSTDEGADKVANEWISMIHALPNNDALIKNLCASNVWQQMQKILTSSTKLDSKLYLETLAKADYWKKLIPVMTATNLPMLSEFIARLLVTPAGAINRGIIPWVIKEIEPRIDSNLYEKQQLIFVLKQLHEENYFSDRLEKLTKMPPKGSDHDKMFFSMYGPNYTLDDIREAVLTSFLIPLRQNTVGSCFATAVALNLNATVDGLKQSFEDFLSIAAFGCISRISPNKGLTDYPIIFNKDFEAYFPKSNHDYLLRAREFAIASTAGDEKDIYTQLMNNWRNVINDLVTQYTPFNQKDKMDRLQDQLECGSLKALFFELIQKAIAARYFGYFKAKNDPVHGGWAVVDAATQSPLISSRSSFENAFINPLRACVKNARGKMDNDLLEMLTIFVFRHVFDHIRSDQFLRQMLGNDSLNPDYFKYDPSNIVKGILIDRVGGDTVAVMRTYFNSVEPKMEQLPVYNNVWKGIFTYIKAFSPIERADVLRNPNQMLMITNSSHAMNMRIGAILPYVAKAASAEEFIKDLEKRNSELMQTAMNKQLQDSLLESFYKQLADYSNDHETQKANIEFALKQNPPKTLKEFCLIVRDASVTNAEPENDKIKALFRLKHCIYSHAALKDKLPPLFNVVDTNWKDLQGMSLCADLEGTNQDLIFTMTGNPYSENQTTSNLQPKDWQIIRMRPPVDDYTRTCAVL